MQPNHIPKIQDDPSQLERLFNEMKQAVKGGQTKSLKFRQKALNNLIDGYEKMIPQISEALQKDLGYNAFMSNFGAHSITLAQIKDLKNGLNKWCKPQTVDTPLALGLAACSIEYQPLGLVLVISAWNYPIYTALPQVAAAIAAGNSVILKPSQLAPYSSQIIEKLFDKYLDKRYYKCIQGKINIARKLTSLPFDLICFTGSTETGKLVAIEAAKNLTPCLLQLGGKCPAIVDQTADIDSAVKRIVFGKFLNCGQTCVGVDHVFVHQSKIKLFEQQLLAKIQQAFGNNIQELANKGDYTKIINTHHLHRLLKCLDQKDHKGKVLLSGKYDQKLLMLLPSVIESPHPSSLLMNEEIFGPILPIIPYHDINNVINEIKSKPKPLVVYLFSQNKKTMNEVKERTSSGSFVVNDAVVQLLNCHLPFGGVGMSGNGRYHGKSGFISFSNPKSICNTQAFNMYPLSTRFPPYTDHKKRMMTFLLKIGGVTYSQLAKTVGIVSFAIAAAVIGMKMRPRL